MFGKLSIAMAFLLALVSLPAQAVVILKSGWNLIGNGTDQAISASEVFGDASQYVSVWKWNSASNTWAFYSPKLSSSDLNSYAASKGYDVLTTINSKEGFWVNANREGSISSTGISQTGALLQASDLRNGWNLVASADAKTPAELNTSLSSSFNASNLSMTSVWAWDPTNASWKFYAPSLDAQSGTALSDYVKSKNYQLFNSALKMSDGFWLNMGAGSGTISTTPGQAAINYANNLKLAVDQNQASIQTELNNFGLAYQNKVIPSMETLNSALNLIDKKCRFDQSTASVSCVTGVIGVTGGTITLTGSGNSYTYSGTVNSKAISGSWVFSPSNTNGFGVTFNGKIPHPVYGGDPVTVNVSAVFNLDQTTSMTGGITISQATVTFPEYANSAGGTLTLVDGAVGLELRNGNVYKDCSYWPLCTLQIDTSATPIAAMPKRITGTLSYTTTSGDVVSGSLVANFVVPPQSIWSALSKEQKFGIKDNTPIEDITFTAKLTINNGKTYSVAATLDPDFSQVDFAKPYSSTNYALGWMQLVIDMGNSGSSRLAKLEMKIERTGYTTAKPIIKMYIGSYDVLTIVPNTTAATYAIDTSSYVYPYGYTDWLIVDPVNNALTDGVKITTSSSGYVTTLTKSSTSSVNGTVMNGTTQVGEIRNGLLYLDGKIFALN